VLKNLIFLGSPGAGKGSIAAMAKALNIVHISTGDIFRANIKEGTALGQKVQVILAKGELVSDELTNEIVKDRFNKGDLAYGFILDGYPRTINQAQALSAIVQIDAVINFVVSEETVIKRLAGRLVCRQCGATYHSDNIKPKVAGICDKCGGELYTRDDDKIEAIKKRLAEYNEKTAPLIDYYTRQGCLYNLNAEPAGEEIFENFKKIIFDF